MKKVANRFVQIICALFFTLGVQAQNTGIFQTYVILDINGTGDNFFAGGINSEGGTSYGGQNFGLVSSFTLNGGQLKSFQNSGGAADSAAVFYNIHPSGNTTGEFSEIRITSSQALTNPGDLEWQESGAMINVLDGLVAGTYDLEVFWRTYTTNTNDDFDSNFGNNYTATFTVETPGFYDDDGTLTICPAGSFCPGDGNSYPCSAGFYASSPGSSECIACTTVCPAGQIISTPCTATSNTVCFACDDNSQLSSLTASGLVLSPAFDPSILSYSASTECLSSVDVTATVVSASSTLSGSTGTVALTSGVNILTVTVTSECLIFTTDYTITIDNSTSPGFYNDNGVCTECPAGSFCPGDGTVSLCPVGSFSASPGAAECELCLAGTAQNQIGSTSCVACPAGTFSNIIGAENCTACASGEYQDQPGSVDCIACDAGSTSPPGSIACTPCAAGEYIDNGICTECPPGSFCPGDGTKTLCPAGRYSDVSGASECLQCLEGTFSGNEGATFCTQCPAGTFSNVTGASACADCPAGTFQANTGATTCDACDPGFCQEETGQTACTACSSADLVLTPSSSSVSECDTITVMVSIVSEDSYNTVEARLNFDPAELKVLAVTAPDGSDVITNNPPFITPAAPVLLDNTNGEVAYAASTSSAGTSGDQDFMRITFEVLGNSGLASLTPIISGFPRSRVATTEFIDGVATPVDILDEFLPTDLTLNPDTEAPVFTCPSNATVDVDANCAITIPDLITGLMGTDNCGSVSFSQSPTVGTIVPASHNQVIDVTITADDGNTNQTTCTVSLTAQDVTAPSITCTSDFTLYLDDAGQASIGSNGSIELANSVNDFSSVQGEKNWEYGTYAGGFNSTFFTQLPYDASQLRYEGGSAGDTPFITNIGGHPNIGNGEWAVRRWTSSYTGAVTISGTLADLNPNTAPGATSAHVRIFQNGAEVYNYFNVPVSQVPYTTSLNVSSGDQIDFVVDANFDTQQDFTEFTAVITAQGASATDNCGIPTITATNINFDCSNVGANTVTFTATDLAGNSSPCNATVTIVDDTAPAFTCPTDATVTLDANCELTVPDLITGLMGTDNCGTVTFTQSPAAGTTFASGEGLTTDVTVTADDGNGNTTPCTVTLTADDQIAPAFTCPADATVTLDANCEFTVPDLITGLTGTDNCGTVTFTQSPAAGSTIASGEGLTTAVTVTANDGNGNTTPCTVTLTADDQIAPAFTCPADATVTLDANCEFTVPDLITGLMGTDNCGTVTFTQSPAAGSTIASGEGLTTDVTVTADDGNGNTTPCTVTLTADDQIAPAFTCPADATVTLDANCELTVPDLITGLTGTDNCGTVTFTQIPAAGSTISSGEGLTTDVTVTADDGNGNTTPCTVTLTADDQIAPAFTCPADATVALDANCELTVPDLITGLTGTDNCGTVTFTQIPAAGATISSGEGLTTDVTVTADDGNGNTTPCTVTLTADDQIAPAFTCPADATVALDANCEFTVPDLITGLTGTDNCGTVTFTQSPAAGATIASGEGLTTDVTVTADDGNGNTTPCTVTLTADDQIAPAFTCPGDATVALDANCEFTVPDLISGLTGTDNCGTVTFTQSPAAGSTIASGEGLTTDVTVTADDGNGNTTPCTVTLTADDQIAPAFTCPADATVALDANCEFTVPDLISGLTGTDNCGTVTFTQSPAAGSTIASGEGLTTDVTVTADDGNGNTTPCTVTLTADDQIAPAFTCPADATVALDANCEFTVPDLISGLTGTDNCGTVTFTQSPAAGATISSGEGLTTDVTVTADDGNGNTTPCTVTLTADDQIAPAFTCPADATVTLDAVCELTVPDLITGLTGTDNCGTVTFTQSPAAGSTFASGEGLTTDVTVTADDGNGNTTPCTVTLTADDQIAPAFTCPADATVALDANCELTVPDLITGLTGTDNCGTVTFTQIPAAGATISSGEGLTTDVTVTADDGNGNTTPCTVTLTADDQIAPAFTCPADATVTLDANCELTVPDLITGLTGTDNCGTVTFTQIPAAGATISSGEGLTTDVTVTADDGNGNTTPCTVTLTADDQIAPAFTCPADATVALDANCEFTVPDLITGLTGTDNCGTVTFTQSPAAGATIASGEGLTTDVTVTADDGNGNTTPCTVTLTADDQIAPAFTCPADATVALDANCEFTVPDLISGLTGTDNCGTVTFTQSPAAGSTIASGEGLTTDVTVTADDGNGNTTPCTVTLTADDQIAPAFTCPADATVALDANCELTVPDLITGLTGTDNCGTVTFTQIPAAGATISSGEGLTTDVTVTADDGNGNTTPCTVTLTADDQIAPAFTCPADATVTLDANCEFTVPDLITGLTGTDNCGTVTFTQSPAAGSTIASGEGLTTDVTVTADDGNGNTTLCTVTLTADDQIAPALICPSNITVSNDAGQCGADVPFTATATDNCGGTPTITYSQDPNTFFTVGNTTVTVTADDGNGNMSTCSFEVTVNDTELPEVSCAGPVTVTINQTNNTYLASGGEFDPTFSDNCSGVTISHDAAAVLSPQVGPNNESLDGWEFPIGTTTIRFTALDASGNSDFCDVTITVEPTVVSGNVLLNGACYPIGMTLTVYPAGSETTVQTLVATLNAQIDVNGDFSVDATGVVPGNYDVYLKPDNYLARLVENVNIGATATNIAIANMIPGDIDATEDNLINGSDVSLILGAYNTTTGDPLFDPIADINCDGFVDALDLSLIIFFFPSSGDSPLE